MKIALISCVSKKLDHSAKAEDLYISSLFMMNKRYAAKIGAQKIFILSAKYGLLKPNEIIKPYNQTLNKMKIAERKKWSEMVLKRLEKESDLEKDEFTFLAGKKYREFLISKVKKYQIPLEGLGIGKQLGFLKKALKK